MERNERLAAIVAHLGRIGPTHGVPTHSYLDLAARMLDDPTVIEAPHIFKQKGDTTEFQSAFVDLSLYQMMATAAFAHLFTPAQTAEDKERESEVSEADQERNKLKAWLESKEGQSAPPEQRLRAANVIAAGEAKKEKSGTDQAFEKHLQKIIKSVPSFSEWSPERKNELASVTRHEWDAARKQKEAAQ